MVPWQYTVHMYFSGHLAFRYNDSLKWLKWPKVIIFCKLLVK
jgi:hypothetical protein